MSSSLDFPDAVGTKPQHIVVIGAGVIGLQCAVSLAEEGYKVTILAKDLPGDLAPDYTSPWAGAHWRSHAGLEDREQQQWDVDTYNYWLSMLSSELNNPETTVKSGLDVYDSVYYSDNPNPPWYQKAVLRYQELPKADLYGYSFTSIMVNVPMYLQFLLNSARSLGIATIRARLPVSTSFAGSLKAAREILCDQLPSKNGQGVVVDAFVNATGLGAGELVPDRNIYPVRGQTIVVKGSAKRVTTVESSTKPENPDAPNIVYVLPRPHSNTSVLGGTKQPNNYDASANNSTTEMILAEAKKWAPELLNAEGNFEILQVNVGFRPARHGGARVEVERLGGNAKSDQGLLVCHAYGHSGAGYQNSVGVARKVVRLLGEQFAAEDKAAARL